MLEAQDVDYIILGVGLPTADYIGTRFNGGYTFCDYFSNCVTMQALLLNNAAETGIMPTEIAVPKGFTPPIFLRRPDLGADIHEADFPLSQADVHTGPKLTLPRGADSKIVKVLKVLIVKPLVNVEDSGRVLENVMKQYKIDSVPKKLIVVYTDSHLLEGTIGFSPAAEARRKAVQSIAASVGQDFIRIRLGVAGEETGINGLDQEFTPSREMDLFGFALDICGQSIQHLMAHNDLKATKKKYGSSKKIPNKLRELPGLIFPIKVFERSGEEAKGE